MPFQNDRLAPRITGAFNASTVNCALCLDPSLPSEYEPWRISMATICLIIHPIVCFLAYSMLKLQMLRPDLHGRDPALMRVILFGMLCCLFAPIRDIASEARTPCVLQLLFSLVARICLGSVHLVRSFRVLALHWLQVRAAAVYSNKERESAALKPDVSVHTSYPTVGSPRMDLRSVVSVWNEPSDFKSPDQAVYTPSPMVVTSPAFGMEQINTEERVQIPEPAEPTVESTSLSWRERISHVTFLMVDACKLHTDSGQVLLLLFVSLPMIINVAIRMAIRDDFEWSAMGCAGSRYEVDIGVIYAICTAIMTALLLRRPDAFKLREEMVTVLIFMLGQLVVQLPSFPSNVLLPQPHMGMYYGIWFSWVITVVVFIMPVYRASRVQPYVDPFSVDPRAGLNNTTGLSPRLAAILDPAREEYVTAYDGATEDGAGSVLQFRQPAHSARALGSMLRYYSANARSPEGLSLSLLAVRLDMLTLLQVTSRKYDMLELQRLTLFMIFQPDCRSFLPAVFSREFCMEMMLLLVDVDSFCRLTSHLEIQWGKFCARLELASITRDGQPAHPNIVDDIMEFRKMERSVCDTYFAAVRAAELLFKTYLRPGSQMTIEIPFAISAAASSVFSEFRSAWVAMHETVWCSPVVDVAALARQCGAFAMVNLPSFGCIFDELEAKIIQKLAAGPISRFSTTSTFEEWRRATRRKLWANIPATCRRTPHDPVVLPGNITTPQRLVVS
jgi:hypothetical protein